MTVDPPVHARKAELFKALGHPARVRVLELLVAGERPVSELLDETGLEASHLSQHLGVLRRAGVVAARREGGSAYYRLTDRSVARMLAAAREFLLADLARSHAALA